MDLPAPGVIPAAAEDAPSRGRHTAAHAALRAWRALAGAHLGAPAPLTVVADAASIRSVLTLYFGLLGVCAVFRLVCCFNDHPAPGRSCGMNAVAACVFGSRCAGGAGWRGARRFPRCG